MPDVYHSIPEPCEYLPDQIWRHMVFWLDEVSPSSFDQLLEMGFRHFGHYFFRNDCLTCNACKGIRIETSNFNLSKSQKRIKNKNADLHYKIFNEGPTLEDKALVDAWQAEREVNKEWNTKPFSQKDFEEAFATLNGITHTLKVYNLKEELIAMSIMDKGAKTSNSIYAVFHPNESHRSLGTYLAILEIEWANQMGILHHYFGHYNEKCSSLNYKARFKPHQISDYQSLSRKDVLKILASLPEFNF